ncbi:MAG: pyridoxamine 5'-phosphate oxidase family protein [Raoultibacter sp.]
MTGNETVLSYLTSIPAWYLATSVDNQPHVRPFSFAAEQDGVIWFCTATTKDVWEELNLNRKFEATAWWPGHGWLILRGLAGLEDTVCDEIRQAGYEHMTGLGESYEGACDPTLVFFSVEQPEAWICTHEDWTPIEF